MHGTVLPIPWPKQLIPLILPATSANKVMEEEMPNYNLFYTDKPLPAGAMPDFSMIMPLNFVSRDEALNNAFKLIFRGAVVWKIEGPDGFHLDRAEIERQYWIFTNI